MINEKRKCQDCGCTEFNACVTNGIACHWVKDDLCSACFNYNETINKLVEDDNKWMNCTFKIMNQDGTYFHCENQVLKTKIDKKNQNNNYCYQHQKIVNEINKKRQNEIIAEFINSVESCIYQMPNNEEFLAILNHVKESFNFNFSNKNLKENINKYLTEELRKLHADSKNWKELSLVQREKNISINFVLKTIQQKLNNGDFELNKEKVKE